MLIYTYIFTTEGDWKNSFDGDDEVEMKNVLLAFLHFDSFSHFYKENYSLQI